MGVFSRENGGGKRPYRLWAGTAVLTLLTTAVWIILFIAGMVAAGPALATFEGTLAYAARLDPLFYLTYVNAALVTLSATALFAGLYGYCRRVAPLWSLLAVIFVPVYTVLNLFAYLSQITIVPRLLASRQTAVYRDAADLLLRQLLQTWPGSAVNVFNNVAYAVLGIPSLIFGAILYRRSRAAGLLLAGSGAASIVGAAGTIAGSPLLSWGSIAGGVLFLLALVPLSRYFWRAGA